jgi:hypothetical protein
MIVRSGLVMRADANRTPGNSVTGECSVFTTVLTFRPISDLTSLHNVISTRGFFPRSFSAWSVKLTTHLYHRSHEFVDPYLIFIVLCLDPWTDLSLD